MVPGEGGSKFGDRQAPLLREHGPALALSHGCVPRRAKCCSPPSRVRHSLSQAESLRQRCDDSDDDDERLAKKVRWTKAAEGALVRKTQVVTANIKLCCLQIRIEVRVTVFVMGVERDE